LTTRRPAERSDVATPSVVVFTGVFPSPGRPLAGVFVKERMFRVARVLPVAVVAPQPWFPGQALVRRFRPGFRQARLPSHEVCEGIDIFRPRYFSPPGLLKRFDSRLMALGAYRVVRRLAREGRVDIIDAHWAFPGGHAAYAIARRLRVPMTVTLRGDEAWRARKPAFRRAMATTLRGASRVFAVSTALRALALDLGASPPGTRVVGNGVDTERFLPMDRAEARRRLQLPADAQLLITVGSLCERKGFHRVIDVLPDLRVRHPGVHYLAIGGPGPEGDWGVRLSTLARQRGVSERVHFTGPVTPSRLVDWLSAADVFVLATRYEGWANVLLEAMACGLPVVATDVGGNAEVVCRDDLGYIVPFDVRDALLKGLDDALTKTAAGAWDRSAIRRYAEENNWQRRIDVLVSEFRTIANVNSDDRWNRHTCSVGASSPTASRALGKS
jgi:glycosyltransferase involved in cell wall biosynthesis